MANMAEPEKMHETAFISLSTRGINLSYDRDFTIVTARSKPLNQECATFRNTVLYMYLVLE